ncbi:MAG: hypothetical protein K0U36_06775 [Alphaproteobacteria bacterium]|nr:hypothetical protein [Alphaproteobacteria bacterium]
MVDAHPTSAAPPSPPSPSPSPSPSSLSLSAPSAPSAGSGGSGGSAGSAGSGGATGAQRVSGSSPPILVVFPTALLAGEAMMAFPVLFALRAVYPQHRIIHLHGVMGNILPALGAVSDQLCDSIVIPPADWRLGRDQRVAPPRHWLRAHAPSSSPSRAPNAEQRGEAPIKRQADPGADQPLDHKESSPSALDFAQLFAMEFALIVDLERVWWRTVILRHFRTAVLVAPAWDGFFSFGSFAGASALRRTRSWPHWVVAGMRHGRRTDRKRRLFWQRASPPPHQALLLFWLLNRADPNFCHTACQTPLPLLTTRSSDGLARQAIGDDTSSRVYVGIVPGSGNPRRRQPLAFYLAVVQRLMQEDKQQSIVPLFILGPHEQAWKAEIRAAIPSALIPAPDAAHRTFAHTISLARQCAVIITHDSGGAHIVARAQTPMVVQYGPTAPAHYAVMSRQVSVIDTSAPGKWAIDADVLIDKVTAILNERACRADDPGVQGQQKQRTQEEIFMFLPLRANRPFRHRRNANASAFDPATSLALATWLTR